MNPQIMLMLLRLALVVVPWILKRLDQPNRAREAEDNLKSAMRDHQEASGAGSVQNREAHKKIEGDLKEKSREKWG